MKFTKKLLAFALACVMTFALAAPMTASATVLVWSVGITHDIPKAGDNFIDFANTIAVDSVSSLDGTPLPTSGVTCGVSGLSQGSTTIAMPFDIELEAGKTYTMQLYISTNSNYAFPSSGFNHEDVTINGETAKESIGQSTNYIYVKTFFTVPSPLITNVDITAPTPVAGQKLSDYSLTIAPTPEGSIDAPAMVGWFSKANGTDKSEYEPITDEDAVFEIGKDYKYIVVSLAKEGYELSSENTVVKVNGVKDEDAIINAKAIVGHPISLSPVIEFSLTPEATTTAAPSTAAAATKTGDAMNPMIYVIALIALVSMAGVTFFATRKR